MQINLIRVTSMVMAGHSSGFYGYGDISDTLAGIFEAMADQEGMHGTRYRQTDIWALLKDVAERRFATAVYEMCHLMRGLGRLDRRGEAISILWQADPATPTSFKGLLARLAQKKSGLPEGLQIVDNTLSLTYSDHDAFEVKSGRMPYLAALFDFTINAIGYVEFKAILDQLNDSALTHKELSALSNQLYSKLYGFLSDHLPAAQGQRKFRQILTYLNETFGEEFQLIDITDETIMTFWESRDVTQNGEGGADFIRYITVFDDFTRFSQSIRETWARRDIHGAARIGVDHDAGEVMPEDLGNEGGVYAQEMETLLAPLQSTALSEIKFVGKKDMESLTLVLDRVDEIQQWALSYLRMLCFGQGQARLTQALRNKIEATAFQALCADASRSDYTSQFEAAQKRANNLHQTLLASLYIQHTLEAKQEYAEKVEINFELLGKLRKAFHNTHKQGFQEEVLSHPEKAPLYEQGADCLTHIKARYDRVVTAMEKVEMSMYDQSDKARFAAQFHHIYGGHR